MLNVKIQCTNIAPLTKLDNEFENKSLKIGVFANNGCGKTFLSRMFRLLEKTNVNDNDGGSILGKTNIDISDDNKRLTELNKNKKDLHDTI